MYVVCFRFYSPFEALFLPPPQSDWFFSLFIFSRTREIWRGKPRGWPRGNSTSYLKQLGPFPGGCLRPCSSTVAGAPVRPTIPQLRSLEFIHADLGIPRHFQIWTRKLFHKDKNVVQLLRSVSSSNPSSGTYHLATSKLFHEAIWWKILCR